MATTDVVTNVKNGITTIKINGNATVYFDRSGNYQILEIGDDRTTTPEAVEEQLTDKFDDVDYYEGGVGA